MNNQLEQTEQTNLIRAFATCGNNSEVCHPFDIRNPECIHIGDHVFIGPKATFGTLPESGIIIKDDVMIGPNVTIFSFNHVVNSKSTSINRSGYDSHSTIVIDEGAWIGAGATLLPNSAVGKGAVVGAGSVVTKKIPKNEIWGGNPAVFIRMRY